MYNYVDKAQLRLILINVLETYTSVSKRSSNMLWILKHDLFIFFCTELANVIFCIPSKDKFETLHLPDPINDIPISFTVCLSKNQRNVLTCNIIWLLPHPVAASRGRGAFPPVGGSSPTHPQSKEKRPKSAIFADFFKFLPLRIAFCPLDARHKKKKKKKNLVPPLATPSGGLIVSQMFSLMLFCSCFHEKDFVHL